MTTASVTDVVRGPAGTLVRALLLALTLCGGAMRAEARGTAATDPGSCAIWFAGSSSIHRWTTLAQDMRPWITHNLGSDGATIGDTAGRLDRMSGIAAPAAIVLYGGDNDIAYGGTAEVAVQDLRNLLHGVGRRFGPVPILILSIKPSPARWSLRAEQRAYNQAARTLAARDSRLRYVEVDRAMLWEGRPGPFYTADGVHMNAEGYALWRRTLSAALARSLPARVRRACAADNR